MPRSRESALEAREEAPRNCEVAPLPEEDDLDLGIGNTAGDDGTISLVDDDELDITLDSGGAGVATVMARVFTGAAEPTALVATARLDGTSTAHVTFAVAELGLPPEGLSWSSSLIITALLRRGDLFSSEALTERWVHGDGKGWRIYDAAIRDARFGGGALDDAAATSLREAADADDGGGSSDGPPLALVTDHPEGWLPEDEAVPAEGEVER